MGDGPKFVYKRLVETGKLTLDPAQTFVVGELQTLHDYLKIDESKHSYLRWFQSFGFNRKPRISIKGFYIFGGVGGGKSMLMDLFFDNIQVKIKRRVHFHVFLQDVHRRFNEFRNSSRSQSGDPIPRVVENISNESSLLCFDELQVYNIVDAMILGRLFEGLIAHGVVIVATSNRHPEDLYKNGLQREKFLPFIKLICSNLEILSLDSKKDYRLERMLDMRVYQYPLDKQAEVFMDQYFEKLCDGHVPEVENLNIHGRVLRILAYSGVARKNFSELCGQPLGAADFLTLANRYHTMIIDKIPKMNEAMENEARRFVTLIDALYEAKVNLICSAEVRPQELYVKGKGAFEFERLVSRLMEMQSIDYLALPHGNSFNT